MFNNFFFENPADCCDRHAADDNIMLLREDAICMQGNYGKDTDPH